ncbi:hypothetical protein KKG05_07565 [bacterium]|nr:hypothetical protein [bacterium]MBU1937241.1 hypothetical protein [bacterium]
MHNYTIFRAIGLGLVSLGGLSGIVLFGRAALGKDKISEGPGIGTLWGLFIIGLVSGIIILASTG